MNEHTSLLPPFVPTRRSVRVLGALFIVSAAISWIAVGFDYSQVRLAIIAPEGQTISEQTRTAQARIGFFVGAAQITILAITAVTFLTWLHRVRVNVRALGARRLSYARQWTILGFLVPFLNALRPYQVVREIWQASDPGSGDPLAWKGVKAPPLIAVWWGLFVAYFVFEAISYVSLRSTMQAATIQQSYAIGLVADLCAALSASFAYFVVARISEAQEAKRSAHGRGTPSSVPIDPRDAVA
jgi:hypothetical protein